MTLWDIPWRLELELSDQGVWYGESVGVVKRNVNFYSNFLIQLWKIGREKLMLEFPLISVYPQFLVSCFVSNLICMK